MEKVIQVSVKSQNMQRNQYYEPSSIERLQSFSQRPETYQKAVRGPSEDCIKIWGS
jgi:hypothetical protein